MAIAFLVGLTAIVGLSPIRAEAQANRTFVSGKGVDTNPCSLSAPCRSFAQAITQTNAGGEITILDPAGYGAVTITTAVSIVNDGVGEAGVTVTSGDAITISAGATDVINLRGLTLVGGGVGANGVTFNSGGTLNMQNCVIRGFTGNGINAVPTAVSNFNISDTVVSNNGSNGILMFTGNGFGGPIATFTRVQAVGNVNAGIFVNGGNAPLHGAQATATNTVASDSTSGFGFIAGSRATFTIALSAALRNSIGLEVDGGGTMYLTQSTVSGSTTRGYDVLGGTLNTYGDNNIANNAANTGSLTPLGHQ
jgi:hypothetical protein